MDSPFAQLTGQPEQADQHQILQDLASGKIPGLNVPRDFQPTDASLNDITPEHVKAAGLAVYKPHDPSIAVTVFNPKVVQPNGVVAADKAGKLTELFQSVADLETSVPTGGEATPSDPAGPSGAQQVPVLPKPATAASQAPLANARNAQLNSTDPTARQIPAGGTLLNGLLTRAR